MNLEQFDAALRLAAAAHKWQKRKSSKNSRSVELPYITHPVAVAALVQRYDGTEHQVIAALLHDVLEDSGRKYRKQIRAFGAGVLAIVEACSDTEVSPKPPWLGRKVGYIAHLRELCDTARRDATQTHPSILVTACDKLANLQAIHLELTETGEGVFRRFSVRKRATLWFYEQVVGCYSGVLPEQLATALTRELDEVFALAQTQRGLPVPSDEDLSWSAAHTD